MAVSAVTMYDFTQFSRPYERSGKKLKPVKTTVFHEHDRRFCLLISADKFPTLFYVISSANFHCRDFACPHTLNRHADMFVPRRTYQYGFYFSVGKQFAIIDIFCRLLFLLFADFFKRPIYSVGIYVANGGDFRIFTCQYRIQKGKSAATQTYNSRFYLLCHLKYLFDR